MVATVSELSKIGRGLYLVKKLFNFVFQCLCPLQQSTDCVYLYLCEWKKGRKQTEGESCGGQAD